MKHREKMQGGKEVPWWLKRLDLVRGELRGMRYPRTAEEGLRQCAELAAVSMGLFKDQIRRSLRTRDVKALEMETHRLMARFSSMDERWKASARKVRVTP